MRVARAGMVRAGAKPRHRVRGMRMASAASRASYCGMSEETTLKRPYVVLLEGRDPADVMRETPGRLLALTTRLLPADIARKPGENKWSIREILCHMADCEVAWAWRLRLIYGAEDAVVQPFDQDPWARAYDGVRYTAAAAIATFGALRAWNLALIETFSDADRQRTAHHPELGELTLWNVVEIAAGHDLHHLRLLEKH